MKHKDFDFQVKSVDESGEFSGYLSVFNAVDSYREAVMPGAFEDSINKWKAKGRNVPILWQHRSAQPIGPFTSLKEDDHGLHVEGRLLVKDVQQSREAHALMKANVISGMSIGYDPIGEELDKDNGVVKLTKIDLWEGSIVTFPANDDARIESVKSILAKGDIPSLSDFESLLRDAGFSRKQATIIASRGLKVLQGEPEESAAAAIAELTNLKFTLKGNR